MGSETVMIKSEMTMMSSMTTNIISDRMSMTNVKTMITKASERIILIMMWKQWVVWENHIWQVKEHHKYEGEDHNLSGKWYDHYEYQDWDYW